MIGRLYSFSPMNRLLSYKMSNILNWNKYIKSFYDIFNSCILLYAANDNTVLTNRRVYPPTKLPTDFALCQ